MSDQAVLEWAQRQWDAYALDLHMSTTLSWDECVRKTIEALGLRPGGLEGVPR